MKPTLLLPGLLALAFALVLAQLMPDVVDVRQYGARAVGSGSYRTTAAGSAGSKLLDLASASIFQNNDGIVIYGGGAKPGITTPGVPSVTPGISETETVPDAKMTTLTTGTASYSYSIVARDIRGGLSAASPITTISNGPSQLGQNTIAVATLNLTKNVITAVTARPHGLAIKTLPRTEGPLLHFKDSSNPQTFSGWWDLSGIVDARTIQITGTSRNSSTVVDAKGGVLTYFTGNKITWSAVPGAWEYVVCARRPKDPSLHVIGVSMPSAGPAGGSYTATSFVDWGPPLIGVNFQLPSYITNQSCTATSPTNDYLSTTVVSGGGTPTLTLKDQLVSSVNGATAMLDAAPGILAAAHVAQQNGQTLYIPATGRAGQHFPVSSVLSLPWSLDVLQVGQLRLGETIIVNPSTTWRGRGSASAPQFAWKASPGVDVEEANPGFYLEGKGSGSISFDSLSIGLKWMHANQALLMVVDGSWGTTFNYVNWTTGGSNDDTGIAVVLRDSANTSFRYPNFLGGPDQVIDRTWTPLVYMPEAQNGAGSSGMWTIEHGMFNRRGILYIARGGGGMECAMEPGYIQGAITPFLALESTYNWVGAQVIARRLLMDTSSQAFLALWDTGGHVVAQVDIEGTNEMGVEASGGRPTELTGIAVTELTAKNIRGELGQ